MGSVSPASLTAALLDATPLASSTPGTPAPANGSGGEVTSPLPADQFTPSNETSTLDSSARAAGLFTVAQASPFTSAADSLLAQSAPRPANGAASTPPAQARPQAEALATATSPDAAAANAQAPSPGAVSVQNQLQTLNNMLQALGLTAADIRKVDQIASRINNFSPTTFTSLAYELVAVAREAAQQTSAVATTNASIGSATGGGATATATKAAGA